MKTEIYKTYSFENAPRWDEVPEGRLGFYHWGSEAQYDTRFKLCFVKNKGVYLRMSTDETDIRAEGVKIDDPVYEDSCMELFLCAIEGREEYINLEMNPKGIYLSEYGKGKHERVYLKSLTDIAPTVTAEVSFSGWSLEAFIPCELIEEAYGESFTAEACEIRGNFYKCGDKTAKPHYGSFNEMTDLPPGFHNPERFAVIRIENK